MLSLFVIVSIMEGNFVKRVYINIAETQPRAKSNVVVLKPKLKIVPTNKHTYS